jgi:glycerophosphoryl diester phosphodiesterase
VCFGLCVVHIVHYKLKVMAKTGIIGHRGAAGLALENSHESMVAALGYAIDAIEFDVRRTLDGRLVVLHDPHTGRIADEKIRVSAVTLRELQTLRLKNDQRISTLEEVLGVIGGKKPVVIDIKDADSSQAILSALAAHPDVQASFTSLITDELIALHTARPDLAICVRDIINPFRILKTARRAGAEAISLNVRLVNPITYWLARKRGLEVRIYTVNSPALARFFRKLYPVIVIYTDAPERFTAAEMPAAPGVMPPKAAA